MSVRRYVRLNVGASNCDDLAAALGRVLDASGLERRDRIEALLSVFVTEALRPHWVDGVSPAEAHERLRAEHPDLARALETVAPMLLGWHETRVEARAAIAWVESLFESTEPHDRGLAPDA